MILDTVEEGEVRGEYKASTGATQRLGEPFRMKGHLLPMTVGVIGQMAGPDRCLGFDDRDRRPASHAGNQWYGGVEAPSEVFRAGNEFTLEDDLGVDRRLPVRIEQHDY